MEPDAWIRAGAPPDSSMRDSSAVDGAPWRIRVNATGSRTDRRGTWVPAAGEATRGTRDHLPAMFISGGRAAGNLRRRAAAMRGAVGGKNLQGDRAPQSPRVAWITAKAATAAVSARRMRGPSEMRVT